MIVVSMDVMAEIAYQSELRRAERYYDREPTTEEVMETCAHARACERMLARIEGSTEGKEDFYGCEDCEEYEEL